MTNEALLPHLAYANVSEDRHYRVWVHSVAFDLANGVPIPDNTNYESCLAKTPIELERLFRYACADG
ncbi:hypothetical protein ACFYYB_04335 [Streptomyces sp. NPDC002886]|uniref:hypothetical protein n=1 Tax=Streptomyces sp. NPDC002886 TaxID=3364667 RepID=UPI0036920686